MATVMGSGTSSQRTGQSLADRLLGGFVPHRSESGGDRLRHDLGMDSSSGWSGPSSSGSSSSSGGSYYSYDGGSYDGGEESSYSVPSTSPLNIPISIPSIHVPQMSRSSQITSTAPIGTAASVGQMEVTKPIAVDDISKSVDESIIKPLGIDFNREAGLDVWERQAAQRENRAPRTANVFGEEYDMSGSDLGWADNQLNMIGNTPINDAYLRAAMEDQNAPLSEDDAWAILHKPDSIDAEKEMNATRKVSPDIYDNMGKVIDDGTKYDYAHMTADKMTGVQYLRYADMGMGGRPVEQIDPTQTYSKRREFNEYGFTPFTPDTSTYLNQMVGNAIELPGRVGTMVGDFRERITPDYTITYGEGEDSRTISGRDYDKLSKPYINQYYYDQQFNPAKFLTNKDGQNFTAHILENVVPDASGKDTYHYGHLTSVDQNNDGTFSLKFSDGSDVDISRDYFDTVYDEKTGSLTLPPGKSIPASQARGTLPEDMASLNDVDALVAMAEKNGGSPLDYADVAFIPDLVLSDGTRMSLEDVERLYYDQSPNDDKDNNTDDDIRYGFQNTTRGGIPTFFDNKPKRLTQQEMFTEDGVRAEDIGNNAIDWTLGSLPISVGKALPWLYSLSNASVSMTGSDPSRYDPVSDSYGLIAGNYDDNGNLVYGVSDKDGKRDDKLSEETRWWNAAGNAAVPFTEMIVGPIGEQIVPLEKIFGKMPANPTLRQLVRNEIIGAIGEGVEEDLGNLAEEATQYGPSGMFANKIEDENGNQVYDQSFHEARDYDTPIEDRVRNMLNPQDLANSFAGGVVVDALMQSPFVVPQIRPALQRSNALRRTGVSQFVEPEKQERRELSDSYLEGFRDFDDEEDER